MLDKLPIQPFGLHVSLTWAQVAGLFDAIERFDVRLFVELGVYIGGLAAMMIAREFYATDFHYLGVELNHQAVDERVRRNGKFIFADVFLADTARKVSDEMALVGGNTLLFCDNGNKPAEVKQYAPLLITGDLLAVHDYGTEIQAEDLLFLRKDFMEIDREVYREWLGMPLFRRL